MTNWCTATLEEVAEVMGGGTPARTERTYFGGAIAWATPTDVTSLDELYIAKTKETVTDAGLKKSSTKLMPAGAVLLTSRATIGFTAVSSIPICTNQGFVNFVCGPNLLPEYLAYWLRTQREKMLQHAGGTTFKEISRGTLRKFEIEFPPIKEQSHIVDVLTRAEGIVRLRREAQRKAAELVPSLFFDLFGDPAKNPKGWPVGALGTLARFVSGGTPAKSRKDYWEGSLPWVSPKDMKSVVIDGAIDKINDRVLEETTLKLIPTNSVLIVVRGMILAHTVPVAITSVPVTINQDMKALIVAPEIDPAYLLWCLRVSQKWLLSKVDEAAHGTKKLDTAKLNSLPIPIPPMELQRKFVARSERVRSIIAQQTNTMVTAQSTFDALLSQSFQPER